MGPEACTICRALLSKLGAKLGIKIMGKETNNNFKALKVDKNHKHDTIQEKYY